tara:strand:- start:121818 stop:123116 length:1299 start_codon:yes stop_codon:yes gene_type:complete
MSLKDDLKKALVSKVMARRLSQERTAARRAKVEKKRLRQALPHCVDYFHQVDDPYSLLAARALKPLQKRYDIELKVHIVGAPDDAMVPQRAKLKAYSRRDASLIAPKYGLTFAHCDQDPDAAEIDKANAMLVQAVEDDTILDVIDAVSTALLSGQSLPPLPMAKDEDTQEHMVKAAHLRKKLGHYLGAAFCYGGESYWGLDRLHYLEERLQALGADKHPAAATLYPAPLARSKGPQSAGSKLAPEKPIDFFVSLRSPYSAIVAKRVFDIARSAGAPVRIRYVLPMVMRGLPVPREKALYIVHDAAREAHRLDVPFGRFNDPLGLPTERGLSLMPLAEDKGVSQAYLISFLEGVWAEGINAGTDRGLRTIAEHAGLVWSDVQLALEDDGWRAIAEANRQELFDLGLWGVPSFHCGDALLWGQDRLWALQEALQ